MLASLAHCNQSFCRQSRPSCEHPGLGSKRLWRHRPQRSADNPSGQDKVCKVQSSLRLDLLSAELPHMFHSPAMRTVPRTAIVLTYLVEVAATGKDQLVSLIDAAGQDHTPYAGSLIPMFSNVCFVVPGSHTGVPQRMPAYHQRKHPWLHSKTNIR